MPKQSSTGKRLTSKIIQHLQAIKSSKDSHLGLEGVNYPVRKTLTPLIPAKESKNPETKKRGDSIQPKDSQRTNYWSCSSDFCNERGMCTMKGELKKCSCLPEYSGEFCEKAVHGPTTGYRVFSFTTALSIVLVALGAFVYLRRKHELKR